MFLDDIIAKKKLRLGRAMEKIPLAEMTSLAEKAMSDLCRPQGNFKAALEKEGLSLIAEVKKASPSKGLIQPDFDPVRIAVSYEQSGADAVSVLTEEDYFLGSPEYLAAIRGKIGLPILRKDFIIDSYQIYEARVIGADAVLLIAAALDDKQLSDFYRTARQLSLDVLAEAHNAEEISRLAAQDFDIIGINNRDLKTFRVNIENTRDLIGLLPKGTVAVCESGIKGGADSALARKWGADAVLVGETLMRSGDISRCVRELKDGAPDA